MTVRELISALETFDENQEVRLAQQPNYPFEYSIDNIVEFSDADKDDPYASSDSVSQDADDEHIVYITEGQQLGYLSKEVWEQCGAAGW